MRSLLLLSAVFVIATAQPWSTPPHLLFTPERYYVGTEATFTLTCYVVECGLVSLQLTYQECTCNQFGYSTCGSDVLYSEDTAETNPIFPSQPITLKVKLPSLDELVSRRYYLSIQSADGQYEFLSRRQISFYNNQFGHMLMKTDKPIYKPGQTVNICVVFLDASLRPHNADSTVEVKIRDSKYKQILKTTVVVLDGEGVGCMDIKLSEEPNLGTWIVDAHLILDVGPGQCQYYSQYSVPRSTCRFKVDEFVLPKFEVNLDGPKQIERNDIEIEGTVSATYTFGEKVEGLVRVNATLTSASRRETFLFYDNTAPLEDGEYTIEIPTSMYKNKVRYRYDPFCVRSTVNIVAEVIEEGRNLTQSARLTVPLVANPVTVTFDDEINPTVFRPGLPYTVQAMASLADGSPAAGAEVQLMATANNGQITLLDRIFLANREGKIVTTVDTTENINCLKFTIVPVLAERTCDDQAVCFSPSPMYSPTNSFLQIENVSPVSELIPGSKATITATATFPFDNIHVVVIGQGNIQLHQATIPSGNRVKVVSFTISIPQAGVPRVKVLGVVARDDGELVADLIEIPVSCQLEHKVDVSFGVSEAVPGDDVSIVTTAEPDSVVVLGVIDKSLTLLAEACKSVDTDNVCGLLRDLTGGNKPASASCSVESESSCCPNSCNEPSKRAVGDIFSAAGITLNTNMFQPRPPYVPNRIPYPYYDRPFFGAPGFLPEGDEIAAAPRPPSPVGDDEGDTTTEAPEPEAESDVRDFFPETWIWQILRTNKSGLAVVDSEVPDTITTWNAEAFAINQGRGLGISPIAQLVVKKDVFVSLELPYSIIFQETVTVIPVIFNFGTDALVFVRVNVTVDDELEVENELPVNGLVAVEQGGSTAFRLRLRPRAIGRLPITICIKELSAPAEAPCIDAVRKNLFVKPGCERYQITTNIFASEETGEQCFNYSLPSCVIPGSQKATISVTGDLVSPPDLDHLLVLPSGCGEQNMVRFFLNVVVGKYLMATEQLPDVLTVKIRNNLQIGYQRQLNYLQGVGCFSIWPHSGCSVWLTAFTLKGLIKATDPEFTYSLGFPEQTELVDPEVIEAAIYYLVESQESSGRWPPTGHLHNRYLMQKDNYIALTGFVLLALKSLPESFNSSVHDAIERAEQYIVRQYNSEEFCNYGLALTTTAMALGLNPQYQRDVTAMVTDLKSRIQSSRSYPGTCFLCNECPDDEESTTVTESCPSRPRGEGSSFCVETTAYALKALLIFGDTESAVCLAQWLVQVKGASGGFYSSQDTLVAVYALTLFAKETFTIGLDKELSVNINSLPTITHTITDENRYEWRQFQVPSVPSDNNCVSYNGNGTAIIQSTLEYHGCTCCSNSDTFALNLATRVDGDQLDLNICVSYQGERVSNMALVDVEVPSGYDYAGYIDVWDSIERVEERGSNVVFYINEVENIWVIVKFIRDFLVENYQQVPVTVFDYYEPDQIVTKYYLPVDSGDNICTPVTRPSTPPFTLPPIRPTRPPSPPSSPLSPPPHPRPGRAVSDEEE